MASGHHKTRNREPKSCFLCRKKKLRCNRETPCTNCARADTSELCFYEGQDVEDHHSEVSILTKKLRESEDKVNYLESVVAHKFGMSSRSVDRGKVHNGQRGTNFDSMILNQGRLTRAGPTSMMSSILNDPYCRTFVPSYPGIKTRGPLKSIIEEDPNRNIPWAMNIHEETVKAQKIFPKLSFVMPLVDRFFEYGPSPNSILDKDRFLSKVWTILLTNGKKKFRLEVTEHYITLAELLVVLRSAYITVAPSNSGDDLHRAVYTGELSIPRDFFDISSRILSCLEALGPPNLSLVPVTMLLISYKKTCPEGYGEESLLMKLNTLAHAMRYRGLATERTNLHELIDTSEIFRWRKLWISLLYLYSSLSFDAGVVFSVPEAELDVSFSVGSGRSMIGEIDSVRTLALKVQLIRTISSMLENSHSWVGMSRHSIGNFFDDCNGLLAKMTSFERLIDGQYGIEDRIEEFRLRLDLIVKLFSIHFKLSLDEENDLDFRKEQYMLALGHGLTIFKVALDLQNNIYDSNFLHVLSSSIYSALVKVVVFVWTLYVRIYEGIFTAVEFISFISESPRDSLLAWLDLGSDISENKVVASLNDKLWSVYVGLQPNIDSDFSCGKFHYLLKTYLLPYLNERFGFQIASDPGFDTHLATNDANDIALFWDDYFDMSLLG